MTLKQIVVFVFSIAVALAWATNSFVKLSIQKIDIQFGISFHPVGSLPAFATAILGWLMMNLTSRPPEVSGDVSKLGWMLPSDTSLDVLRVYLTIEPPRKFQ